MLTFIKRSIDIWALFVLIALALLVPFVSWAQGADEAGDTSLDSGETMVNTNISNASMIGQDEENLVIGFTLENNGTRPQFNVRYGIELISTEGVPGEETQVVVDTFVAREEVVISAGESVSKVIGYPFAGIPPGTYEIWVIAQTLGGATVGIAKAADYTVTEAELVEIMAKTCVLTVAGEAGTAYDLYQGVDVSASEDIILTCTLKNHGATAATVVPNYMTYERNIYGNQVTVVIPTQTAVTLAAGAQREVSFTIPKATMPQAYDVVLSLVDQETRAVKSNNLIAHYVIQGASATIQNVGFDKNAYRAGEAIGLNLNWTPAADTFEESRSGGGTNVGTVSAVTRVVDGNGAVCSEEVTTPLGSGTKVLTSTSMIDCVRPAASVQLVSANGTVLDSREIAVEVEEYLGVLSTGDRNSALMFATVVAFALALLAVLIAMNRHKKIDFINASKMLFIFAIAATGFFGVNIEKADALTWGHEYYNSSGYHRVNVTVNANKTVFSPGETIVLTSRVVSATCTNGRTPAYRLRAYLDPQMSTLGYMTVNTTSHNGGGTLIAPTTPGVYNIRLEMKVLSYISNRNLQISVNAPPPPPPPPESPVGSVSGNNCIIAIGASTCNTRINWSTSFATNPNLRNVTRSYTYAYGATGSANYELWGSATGNNVIAVRDGTTNLNTTTLRASCAAGSGWNGSICEASASPLPPTATISVTSCEIPAGASSCPGSTTWDIDNATNPNVHNSLTNTTYSTSPSGTNQPTNLTYGVNTVNARDGSSALASTNVAVSCAAGSNWNGSICDAVPPPPPEPSISLMLSRELIRSGETVDVTVDVSAAYTAECTVYGVASTPIVFTHNGTPASPYASDVFTSRPLTAAQVVTVTCVPDATTGAASNTATSRVDVIPVVEEI